MECAERYDAFMTIRECPKRSGRRPGPGQAAPRRRAQAHAQNTTAALPARGLIVALGLLALAACARTPRPGSPAYQRRGDEIVIAGQLFHTGAPVVLWTDPGGYDAYRVERRFAPIDQSSWDAISKPGKDGKPTGPESPNHYNLRSAGLTNDEIERVRGGGWDLPTLRRVVDQFVIHYDVCGTSRQCFKILHDVRGLSVHFMLDADGTIYQTLDLKERAWHATTSNHRSVGIEIANIGAYADGEKDPFDQWYARDALGTVLTIPAWQGDGGIRTPNFVGRPIRPDPVVGQIQGKPRRQYDLTPQQYDSLIKLTAALCTALPAIRCDCPRNPDGSPTDHRLPDDQLRAYTGVLGHYHIQDDKADPGPAFQWEYVIGNARLLMNNRRAAVPPG